MRTHRNILRGNSKRKTANETLKEAQQLLVNRLGQINAPGELTQLFILIV